MNLNRVETWNWNWCQNPEMRKRRRINKTKSERRRFKPFSQRSMVNCFVLLLLRSIRARQIRLSSSFFILLLSSVLSWILDVIKRRRLMTGKVKKKVVGSHPGLARWTGSRVDPPGRPGLTGPIPKRVLASTRTCSMPGSAGSQVDPPGWSGFKYYAFIPYNFSHI